MATTTYQHTQWKELLEEAKSSLEKAESRLNRLGNVMVGQPWNAVARSRIGDWNPIVKRRKDRVALYKKFTELQIYDKETIPEPKDDL